MLRGLLNQHQIIKRFVLFCIAGLIVVGSFSDWAVAFTFDPAQNLSPSSNGATDPRIAVSGSQIFIVWEDGPGNYPFTFCHQCNIFFRRSLDSGVTWKPALDQPAINLSAS